MGLTKSTFGWLRDGIGNLASAQEIERQISGLSMGKVFYVNPATGGADDYDTQFPDIDGITCFSTHQGAIDACVSNRGDLIIVKRGYEAVTTPVLFNKAGITMVAQGFGMPPREQGEYFCIDCSSGPAAILSLPCHIKGLGFHTSDTGTKSCNMRVDGDTSGWPGWYHIEDCRFPNWGTATEYGINFEGGANSLVSSCTFEGTSGGQKFAAGIAYGGGSSTNPIQNEVDNCRFRSCDYAIEHVDGSPQKFLYHSSFVVDGKRLNSNGALGDGNLCNWYLETAATATASDDVSIADLKTGGINCSGNHYLDT